MFSAGVCRGLVLPCLSAGSPDEGSSRAQLSNPVLWTFSSPRILWSPHPLRILHTSPPPSAPRLHPCPSRLLDSPHKSGSQAEEGAPSHRPGHLVRLSHQSPAGRGTELNASCGDFQLTYAVPRGTAALAVMFSDPLKSTWLTPFWAYTTSPNLVPHLPF